MEIVQSNLKFKNTTAKRKSTKQIILHCTASREGQNMTVESIHQLHLKNGWSGIGYHYVIGLDGTIYEGRKDDSVGAHAAPQNSDSIGIVYVGGLDANKKPKDTRTPEQKESIIELIKYLLEKYPSISEIKGHRDISPDKNGNGIIEPSERIKSCPCFDAVDEYKGLILNR